MKISKKLVKLTTRQLISTNIRILMERNDMKAGEFTEKVNLQIEKLLFEGKIKPRAPITRNQLWKYYKKESPTKPGKDILLAISGVFRTKPEEFTTGLIIEPLDRMKLFNETFSFDEVRFPKAKLKIEELNKSKSDIENLMSDFIKNIDILLEDYKRTISGKYQVNDSVVSKEAVDFLEKAEKSLKKMTKKHGIKNKVDSKLATPEQKNFRKTVFRANKNVDFVLIDNEQIGRARKYEAIIDNVVLKVDELNRKVSELSKDLFEIEKPSK
ncbi:hypothetical protein [Lactococcus lactis]|uniref:hypothetical protein n=1 Tax=Lactococcus lactis TaxID=1358 RepID=UPI001F532696|nr:hypothetical protein [Lactococcus lactis]MCI1071877.1 hypothetical protein [Lactococcus lactis]